MAYTLLDDSSGGSYTLLPDEPMGPKPKAIGQDANADFLRDELKNTDWFTRNLAGAGVGVSNAWEGLKQLFPHAGQYRDPSNRIEANKVIAQEAPVGDAAGNIAMLAGPGMAMGTSVKGAAALGGMFGFVQPTKDEGLSGLGQRLKTGGIDAALSAGGQKVANLGGEYLAQKLAGLKLKESVNAPRDAVIREAGDAGLVAPPSSVDPSWWNTLKESFGGKIATAQEASNKNAPKFEQSVRTDLAIPSDVAVTPEVLQSVRDRAYKIGYKPVEQLPSINWNPEFLDGLKALSPKGGGGAVKSPAQGEIEDLISGLANQNQWTGSQLVHDIRTLREQARANYGAAAREGGNTAKTDLAKAQTGAVKLLEDLVTSNTKDPVLMANLQAARKVIAKAHDAEDALIPGGGLNARSWVKDADLMDGQMGVAAKFAAQFPKASQTPQQIAGPGVSKVNAFLSALMGTGGAVAGGPLVAAAAAAAPLVVPPAIRAQMLSQRAQRNVLRDMYDLSLASRGAVGSLGALKYAPVGLADPRVKSLFE